MKPLLKCPNCGFIIETIRDYTDREKLKTYKESLVTAKLFGCSDCVNEIQNIIEELKND